MNTFMLGQQLWVNNKWFFDILSINETELTVRIKYKEAINREYDLYKQIKLPVNLIQVIESNDIYASVKIEESKLKSLWGSLVQRISKEYNPYNYKMNEDVGDSAGMGAVSNPGFSGTPGEPGTAGSGDIINTTIKASNRSYMSPNQSTIRKAMLDLIGLKENLEFNTETENDYKALVYNFLDYPWEKDYELELCKEASIHRADFTNASSIRIKEYFTNLSNINKALISKCSDTFQNNLLELCNQEA